VNFSDSLFNFKIMQTFIKVKTVQRKVSELREKNAVIGFVPTMGALHEGHISLIRESVQNNDYTVCSIFVNPTQFNNKEDLEKYPRTKDKDVKMLKDAGTDILFYPDANEIYPINFDNRFDLDLEGIDKLWEGEFRPGHFKGVVQVVKRLLDIVEPDNLYMGQKDIQQFTIIGKMLEKIMSKVKLIIVPTMRESDGLAMSSRNVRLSKEYRKKSVVLFKALNFAKENLYKMPINLIESGAIKMIQDADLQVEYFKLVNAGDLTAIENLSDVKIVGIIAVWAGDVRLIDNMILN
jgi:pantoate--beta-alanine ligase